MIATMSFDDVHAGDQVEGDFTPFLSCKYEKNGVVVERYVVCQDVDALTCAADALLEDVFADVADN
jgi:hypothetical protein